MPPRTGNQNARKHGAAAIKTKTYRSWVEMRYRCTNPKSKRYKDYGGRGITIDSRWNSFQNFVLDMGECPLNCTLDRINNDTGYSRQNCRWATYTEQNNNRRTVRKFSFKNETHSLAEWARKTGISYQTLRSRLNGGMLIQQALEKTNETVGTCKEFGA